MKKFYSILLLAIMSVIGISAQAQDVNFKIEVDNASRVEISYTKLLSIMPGMSSQQIQGTYDLTNGYNDVTGFSDGTIIINAKENCSLVMVMVDGISQTITDNTVTVNTPAEDGFISIATSGETSADPGQDPQDPQTSEKYTVTFQFNNAEAESYIVRVRNSTLGEFIDNFKNGFEVDANTTISMELNDAIESKIEEFTVNGVEPFKMFTNSEFTVTENTVVVVKAKEQVINHYTVNIDNIDRAEIGYITKTQGSFWQPATEKFNKISLVNGTNSLEANPDDYTSIRVQAIGRNILSSVTVDGVEQTITDGYVDVTLADGMVINIVTEDAPALKDFNVTFDFSNDDAKQYITTVLLNGEAVADFANGFVAQEGSTVTLYCNDQIEVEEFTINGEAKDGRYGPVEFTITKDTEIYVKAKEYITYHFTVNVDDPNNIQVGYNSGSFWTPTFNVLPLTGTSTELSVNEKTTKSIIVKASADDVTITSIKVDGQDVAVDAETVIVLADGMVIDVTTEKLVRDAVCTVYIDNPANATLSRGDANVGLSVGSQEVEFNSETESTFVVKPVVFFGTERTIYLVTLNGNAVAKVDGAYTINDVQNGDEIKILCNQQTAQISAGGYTTFCPINSAVVIPDGVTAYTVEIDAVKEAAVLTEVAGNILPQGCGVVLEGNAIEYLYFTPTADDAILDASNMMVGVTEAGSIPATAYVLGVTTENECIFGRWSGTTFPAGKAYLKATAAQNAPLRIIKADDTTGIENVAVDADNNVEIYNISGQKVSNAYRGFVIKNGRKVINK